MAVIVALSAVLLFSVAALCVDLGNAYSRKRSLQTQADFAAFAAVKGGANLPAATTTPLASQDAVIQAAAYLNRNLPQDDAQGPRTCEAATPPTCITAAQLVNGRLADGEVKYGHYVGGLSGTFVPSKNEITVITPKSLVDYGLAQAMGPGHDSLNLQTKATVAIKSAKDLDAAVLRLHGLRLRPADDLRAQQRPCGDDGQPVRPHARPTRRRSRH